MSIRAITLIVLLFTMLPLGLQAQQTQYITDELQLDMRSGPGNQYRIQQMLSAGTEVQVLDSQEGWTQVRVPGAQEGWVLTRMLSDSPSARARLESAEGGMQEALEENEALSTSLAQAEERIAELDEALGQATSQRDRMRQELEQASQGLEYYEDNQELRKQVIDLRRELQDMAQENERLRGRNDQQWFMVGGMVLGAGILFGLIIPRIRWRRQRSSWGSGGL
ncbi:TIGR04211 family SH3 domain-containing protein [Methylonatrum kenyense]|uniref:TIGR04211 family SH3 domain-containing protein n=1 Tax=Methylonatrum kenyense TaxID=455253 RepID=UPI0020BE96B1|nr:TIGR04211 family SH3 domain-containing protein [Methylonatrum kenyense]